MPETQKPAAPADEQGGDAGNAQADGGKIQAQKAVTAAGRTRYTAPAFQKHPADSCGFLLDVFLRTCVKTQSVSRKNRLPESTDSRFLIQVFCTGFVFLLYGCIRVRHSMAGRARCMTGAACFFLRLRRSRCRSHCRSRTGAVKSARYSRCLRRIHSHSCRRSHCRR